MKVFCFGDSNTYGFDPRSFFGGRYDQASRWVDILAEISGWTVENAGQNGLSIPSHEHDIDLYKRIISRSSFDLLSIMLGSNDLLQGYGAEAVAKKMDRFISSLSVQREKILLVSPVPFKAGLWIDDEKCIEHSKRLASLYHELSLKLGIAFADSAKWNISLCYDGVHFSEIGHKAFAKNIYETIKYLTEE